MSIPAKKMKIQVRSYNSTFLQDFSRNIKRKVVRVDDTLHKAQVPWELPREHQKQYYYKELNKMLADSNSIAKLL